MHVRLDQAGHQVAARAVHHLGVGRRCQVDADLTDTRAAHEDVGGDRTRSIGHREQGAAAQQDGHYRYARSRSAVARARVPRITSSAAVASSAQCERPPMLGTKIIAACAAALSTWASWPAPLVI